MERTLRRTHWVGVKSISGVQGVSASRRRKDGGSERGVLKPEREGDGARGSCMRAMSDCGHQND